MRKEELPCWGKFRRKVGKNPSYFGRALAEKFFSRMKIIDLFDSSFLSLSLSSSVVLAIVLILVIKVILVVDFHSHLHRRHH